MLNCDFNDEDKTHSLATKSPIFEYFIFNRFSDAVTKLVFNLQQRDLITLELVKIFLYIILAC